MSQVQSGNVCQEEPRAGQQADRSLGTFRGGFFGFVESLGAVALEDINY